LTRWHDKKRDNETITHMIHHFGIIGGGLVGLATALQLRQAFPASQIIVWEKESTCGQHQSSHNSGVAHAGLYYAPGSLKAQLAVQGLRDLMQFCRTHHIAHEQCGKVIVATTPHEVTVLQHLQQRGTANGLQGLRWLDRQALRDREPYAEGLAALLVPEEGIVDYGAVIETFIAQLTAQGVTIRTNAPVTALYHDRTQWQITTPVDTESCHFLINCAGLQCDRIAKLALEQQPVRIIPFRGDYYRLKPARRHLIRHLIYPVPDQRYPFLGVHFTRTIKGEILVGPNAVLAAAREGYQPGSIHARDLAATISFPGVWRFAWHHRHLITDELTRSISRQRFCSALQRLVPALRCDDLEPATSGIRAQLMTQTGTLVQDFYLVRGHNALHVLNAPSPAATACLALGRYIVQDNELALKAGACEL
jgi:L-2-hydroxyglutarate oxidase